MADMKQRRGTLYRYHSLSKSTSFWAALACSDSHSHTRAGFHSALGLQALTVQIFAHFLSFLSSEHAMGADLSGCPCGVSAPQIAQSATAWSQSCLGNITAKTSTLIVALWWCPRPASKISVTTFMFSLHPVPLPGVLNVRVVRCSVNQRRGGEEKAGNPILSAGLQDFRGQMP